MKKIIITSLIVSIIVSIGIIIFVYKYLPLFPVDRLGEQMLGTTLTTLSGTDTMSGFPTVYNANLVAMNVGKIEISTTTLPLIITLSGLTTASSLDTIGTIGTGVWEGTAITVAYQGTGTTSPTLNQVILGNAASGFKVVSGFGSSGQFLTSAGSAAPPVWETSSINEAGTYDWTGIHDWTNNVTMASTSITQLSLSNVVVTSSATEINFLDGISGLSRILQRNYTDVQIQNTTATTTIATMTLLGGTLGLNDVVRIVIPVFLSPGGNSSADNGFAITVTYGSTETVLYAGDFTNTASDISLIGEFVIYLMNTTDTSSQEINIFANTHKGGKGYNDNALDFWIGSKAGTASEDSTTDLTLSVEGTWPVVNSTFDASMSYIEVITK